MKMIIITYNEAIDMEVMEGLEECGVKNYTKTTGVFGKGATSGTHLGTDVWPGRNNILHIAAEDECARRLMKCVRGLRTRHGREGVKAFCLPVEDAT